MYIYRKDVLYKSRALLYKFWLPYPTTNILVYLTSSTDNIPDIPINARIVPYIDFLIKIIISSMVPYHACLYIRSL